jgi:hypothetical protein
VEHAVGFLGIIPPYLRRFSIEVDSGCWVWQGPPASAGHGQTWTPDGTKTAHRAVWESLFGTLPAGYSLHHLCPNRLCVNPEHQQPKETNKHRSDHCKAKWARQKADPSLRLIGRAAIHEQLCSGSRSSAGGLSNPAKRGDLSPVPFPGDEAHPVESPALVVGAGGEGL